MCTGTSREPCPFTRCRQTRYHSATQFIPEVWSPKESEGAIHQRLEDSSSWVVEVEVPFWEIVPIVQTQIAVKMSSSLFVPKCHIFDLMSLPFEAQIESFLHVYHENSLLSKLHSSCH